MSNNSAFASNAAELLPADRHYPNGFGGMPQCGPAGSGYQLDIIAARHARGKELQPETQSAVGVHEGPTRHYSIATRRVEWRGPTVVGTRMTRRLVAGIAATVILLLFPACASRSYMGIPLAVGQADPELQQFASRARAGNKHAQLELGIRFEEGRGVERDIAKARDMYRLAASDSGGTVWVYVPPTAKGLRGRVIPVTSRQKTSGLAEAKARLDALERAE